MDTIAVVSCVWQRPERLERTLAQLAAQTHTDFVLLLINNNPALRAVVETAVRAAPLRSVVLHSQENRGPFARIEVMHNLREHYAWFMTIDDDAEFGPGLLAQWWALRDAAAVQGWSGFRFTGNYWQRQKMGPGEPCHYLWGSNLFVPTAAVQDAGILDLEPKYWQCDDLWLCFYANHVLGLTLRAQKVDMRIEIDGKDTYMSQIDAKRTLLDELRRRGWAV